MLNLHHLQLFHAVAERGSVTAAARAVAISQPAVSSQIHELERALGVPLFVPAGRGLRLTEAGQLLDAYARQIFGLADAAERAIRGLVDLEGGRLAVGAIPSFGIYSLPATLRAFRSSYPGVELTLTLGGSRAIAEQVLAGELELGFVEAGGQQLGLEEVSLQTEQLGLIVAPDHPLARRASVHLRDLADAPFILRESSSPMRQRVEAAFARAGLPLRPAMVLDSTAVIKEVVAAGLGISLVAHAAAAAEIAAGRLCMLQIEDAEFTRPLARIARRGVPQMPAAAAFLALLAETPGAGHSTECSR